MAKNKNPISERDKKSGRIVPDLETDVFGDDEQKKIVKEILRLAESDIGAMGDWLNDRELDIQHYDGERPTLLEGVSKRAWQSDRNLGLCAAVSDTFQSVLLATVWNPDSIHFVATEKNDFDTAQNKATFTKWGMGKSEANFFPELDDFIFNRINQGFSVFEIAWEVKYQWVDRRIPKEGVDKNGKRKKGFTIKTEKVRFERGTIKNIDNVDDILIPTFGKSIQDLNHFGLIIHTTGEKIKDKGERGIFMNVTDDFINKIRIDEARRTSGGTEDRKKTITGEKDQTSDDIPEKVKPFDLYKFYMMWDKGGKEEMYRFIIEPSQKVFLSGKPVRKITRSGKIPYVGGPFIRIPGRLRGKSLPRLISPIVNALNNTWNQKSDFQTIQNMPFGFHNPEEGFTKQVYELEPGKSYPIKGSASDAVFFPNLQRSLAWADQDFRFLFEMLERLTGAASFFQTQQRNASGTATRDILVEKSSTTRFGLWVNRILDDIAEAITLWLNMYQDWAPKRIGERVLGEDGKHLITNLSIESLRGDHDARMVPDITSGSKVFEQQMFERGMVFFGQSIWADPSINPKGNYNFTSDALKKIGFGDTTRYMGPEPPEPQGNSKLVQDEWSRFLQGESFPTNEDDNIIEHLVGHMRQKEEKFDDLDKEYRPNFDDHLFSTFVQYSDFLRKKQEESLSTNFALKMVGERQQGTRDESGLT